MNVATQTLRQRAWRRVATIIDPQAYQHRSTSWIAWEQPNPALYTPLHAAPSSESRQVASNSQGARNVGDTGVASATAAIVTSSQEISTSGKIAPSSIQASASHFPYSQTRSVQTQSENTWLLPTTLLRIPGVTATWPTKAPDREESSEVRRFRPQE
ncbi:hypothetical protein F5Y00DRAFT_264975 [Daldinia vernicosa]|uniref:uncharacterized protein n=1 Tax=Daldinia vernicosa TaxID=114800 RepID=UPI0020074415|nr:uncharacterized protein F5Y00DRAFT_264975 [Daldinia vernicosa]KAI0846082.1 hypothetical protein F5Y00DRAFT_264975 [Daldinia vernicosa]